MSFIRQRLITLQNRAKDLQTTLRRWMLYDDSIPSEHAKEILARFTPQERSTFEADVELTKDRLRPLSAQLRSVSKWYDYVLEKIDAQLDRARSMFNQERHHECLAVLNDVEARMLTPNEGTLEFVFRSLQQHISSECHQKIASIDTIARDLYLPTIKLAHERGLLPKDALAKTPTVYLTDAPDAMYLWQHHAREAVHLGRRLPLSMMAVPRRYIAQPWNLGAVTYEVGRHIYADLDLSWECVNKLQTESLSAGVSPQTAQTWARWHEVIFADIFGVLKLGSAYVSSMIELLGTDVRWAVNLVPNSPAPPAYIRWHVMLQALEMFNAKDRARELYNQIHLLFGDPNQLAQQCGPVWLQLLYECRAVAGLVAFSPCQRLNGARLVDVARPFLGPELQNATKVKDLLLAGDESCALDEDFTWCDSLMDVAITAPVVLAGLRMAYDATADVAASRRICVRFWCLMQFLMHNVEQTREREDREFAPEDATLRSLAQEAAPVMV